MLNLGKETVLKALGKSWTFSRLTLGMIEDFQAWIKEQVGDPFEDLERFVDKLPAAEALTLFKEARAVKEQLQGFSLSNELAQRFLGTERGAARLAWLLLRERHPDVDESTALAIFLEMGHAGIQKVIQQGSGSLPNANIPA